MFCASIYGVIWGWSLFSQDIKDAFHLIWLTLLALGSGRQSSGHPSEGHLLSFAMLLRCSFESMAPCHFLWSWAFLLWTSFPAFLYVVCCYCLCPEALAKNSSIFLLLFLRISSGTLTRCTLYLLTLSSRSTSFSGIFYTSWYYILRSVSKTIFQSTVSSALSDLLIGYDTVSFYSLL